MPRKWLPSSTLLVIALAGCSEQPAAPSAIAPTPPPETSAPDIAGFKMLELGMTLDQLTTLRTEDFDGSSDLLCIEDTAQAMRCRITVLSIAEAPAEIEAMFLAKEPIAPLELQPVPPQYHPSWQEIRLGNEAQEEAKARASQREREHIGKENRVRELQHLEQFALAHIEIVTDRQFQPGIEQALRDRYGDPAELPSAKFQIWDSPTGRIVLSDHALQTRVSYTYHPLDEARERYYAAARENRAGDL